MAAEKATGETPAALITPEPPDALRYLLTWFDELAAGRPEGPEGAPQRLSWAELQAWAQCTCRRLQPWEVQALRRLDALWREAWIKGRPKPRPPSMRRTD